jgi:predicted nucleic acid-binding protein
MIVVDTNVLVFRTLPFPESPLVRSVMRQDRVWVAPPLWRSEFRNAAVGLLRGGRTTLPRARTAFELATALVGNREHEPETPTVLQLADDSRLTAYDLEFVAVARDLDVRLVTFDRQILAAFPGTAVHPADFVERAAGL